MPAFQIGPRTFPTKKAAGEEVSRILHGSPLNVALSGDEYALIRDLLDLHPNAVEKIGAGVLGISVRDSGEYASRCFHAHRVDGTIIDFSKKECFSPSSHRVNVTAALRWEVQDQLDDARNQVWHPACELCGKLIIVIDEVDIDHADRPFAELRDKFVVAAGGWDNIKVENDGATRMRLSHRELAEVWKKYHQHMARLRPLHRRCHRGLGR